MADLYLFCCLYVHRQVCKSEQLIECAVRSTTDGFQSSPTSLEVLLATMPPLALPITGLGRCRLAIGDSITCNVLITWIQPHCTLYPVYQYNKYSACADYITKNCITLYVQMLINKWAIHGIRSKSNNLRVLMNNNHPPDELKLIG